MKKMLLIFMCLFLPSLSQAYTDIDTTYWAYEDISELKNRNIVSGYPDGTFRADENITEEELVTILFNVANFEVTRSLVNWPEDYINLAQNNGINITKNCVTKQRLLELSQSLKNIKELNINGKLFPNRLNSINSFVNERELIGLTANVTRADVCKFINNLLKMSKTKMPVELVSQNEQIIDVKTIVNSIEIAEFNSYDGKYQDIIGQIKKGTHPYLEFRRNKAINNYLLIIEFDTVNNSIYQVPTSYNYLDFEFMKEKIDILDSFDLDEINRQSLNLPYDGVYVESNTKYSTIAFYILDKLPQSLIINRDINTAYDMYTNKYININQLNSAKINL